MPSEMGEERDQPWNFHTCRFCPYRSKRTFLMVNHVRLHRRIAGTITFTCDSNTPEMFECEICEFEATLKVNLSEHCRVHHEEKDANDQIENILKCYRCKGCNFVTHSVILIAKHINHCVSQKKFNKKCLLFQKENKSVTTISHSNSFACELSTLEKFECDFCDFHTDFRVYLIAHFRVRHDKKESNEELQNMLKCYTCKSCPFITHSVIVMAKHLYNYDHVFLEMESSDNRAGKPVQNKSETSTKKENEKLLECNICSLYKTTRKDNLKRHILSHSKPKEIGRFECAHCGLKFKKKSYLRNHFKMKHGNPKHANWFKCSQCQLETKYKRCLARHMRKKHNSDWW